jgi:hypothetical protein
VWSTRSAAGAGAVLFAAAGECVRDLGLPCTGDGDAPCPPGSSCVLSRSESAAGSCKCFFGSCRAATDCPDGFACEPSLILAAAADRDGDEIADPFDNCAGVANPAQLDADADGIGDACQQGAVSPTPPATTTPTPPTTSTPSATATPTASASATASLHPSETPAPSGAGGGDGCRIGGGGGASAWPFAFPAALWLARRKRTRRLLLVLGAILLTEAVVPAQAQSFAPCPGDCDADRRLALDELIAGVRIASGTAALAGCSSLDADASASVEIHELVRAVDHAMNGCPATIDPDALAVLLPAVRALDEVSNVLMESLQFFNGTAAGAASTGGTATGGGAGECPRGGMDERNCEVLGDGLVRIPYLLDRCTYAGDGTLVTIEGRTALIGIGSCPGLFLPSAARFEIDQTLTIREARILGRLLSESRIDIGGVVESVALASAACALSGADLRFGGAVVVDDGRLLSLDLDRARIGARFGGSPCRPERSVLGLDGDARLIESSETSSLEIAIRSSDLTLTREMTISGATEISVAGTVDAPDAGGSFSVATLEPLLLEAGCPAAGALDLRSRGGGAVVRFSACGSVTVDLDGDEKIDRSAQPRSD